MHRIAAQTITVLLIVLLGMTPGLSDRHSSSCERSGEEAVPQAGSGDDAVAVTESTEHDEAERDRDEMERECANGALIEFTLPMEDDEVVQGVETTLHWQYEGPIEKVRLYFYYDRTPLGGESRDSYGRIIYGQMLPNEGQLRWEIPWMDTDAFRLRIAGYDANEEMLAEDEIRVHFRPTELKELPANAIAVIRERQRLYYYEDHRIQLMYIVSTGAPRSPTPRMAPGTHGPPGEMGRVFGKQRRAYSRAFGVEMPYWLQITSSGSHGIHATMPQDYRDLGRPASAGCVRLHLQDARTLFEMVEVGTPVYVF